MSGYPPNKIPITKTMCELMGFDIDERYHKSGNYDWVADKGMIKIHSLNGEVNVFLSTGGGQVLLEHVKFVSQVQWLFFYIHNEKI